MPVTDVDGEVLSENCCATKNLTTLMNTLVFGARNNTNKLQTTPTNCGRRVALLIAGLKKPLNPRNT